MRLDIPTKLNSLWVESVESRTLFASATWDVVLIDRTLSADAILARAIVPGGRVILYDGRHDSASAVLERVADWADRGNCTIGSLSLLSHASAGRFALGNEWISNSTVDGIGDALTRLGESMADGANINLFGCNLIDRFGGGQKLIDTIAQRAHARVFASTNITGLGGDWTLEAASRDVNDVAQPRFPFSERLLEEWPSQLATPGITVTPTSGLVTTEYGATTTFTVKLDSNPGGGGGNAVTIGLSTSDSTEGTVSVSSLVFNNTNWNTPQTVTVTGVDDAIADGNIAYSIITAPASTLSVAYLGMDAADVSLTNVDNDTPGITVSPTSGLTTTEAGGTTSFSVHLDNAPSANVTIPLSSSNTAEGTISTSSLTFTTANWNTPQTVTVTGVDDLVDDGNVSYSIVTGAATSADVNYSGLNASDVSVSNTDDDTAGITVTPTSGLVTTEAGGTASFTIVLKSQPTANVAYTLSSNKPAEGTPSVSSLTFTPANWNTPQTITVTGVDDFVDDGDIAYRIVTSAGASSDPLYNGVNPANVLLTNTDDDTAGITVTPTSGLVTSEAGATSSFTIVLASKPTASVSIGLSSSNTAEGTISAASVTFTTVNWNIAQTITLTGANDFVDDGDVAYSIVTAAATSTDPNYSGFAVADVSATNTDNDTAGITVTPTSGLTTTEAGGTASFTVVLDSQPTANVTVPLSSNNIAEGTIATASLLFTAANWNTPQTVVVTGADEFVDDGDIAYSIVTGAATSADPSYSARNASDVSLTNTDNDTAGVTVTPTSGLTTTEAGGTTSFTVVLTSRPLANVTIGIASSDTSEGTLSASSLTFTPFDWNAPQTVTITGVDDSIDDGDIAYTIITAAATSGDANYNSRNPSDVSLTNTDDDVAGIHVSPTSGLSTSEAGGATSFTIVLDSQPTSDVTIGISSSNTAEATISAASLTFTSATWNVAQTVTVTGVDDFVDDGNVAFSVITAAASSSDPRYSGLNAADVSGTNVDNDTAAISVTPTSGLTTTEAGGIANFNIVLTAQPLADVTIPLSSSNTAEGTIAVGSVTFTSSNWNVAQQASVTGVDDSYDDGDAAYSIVTGAATSVDTLYSGMASSDVALTNTDNDTAGATVTPTSGLATTEAGGTTSFTVVLNSKPTANVTIAIASSNTAEGTVSAPSLTFTTGNWNTPQTITITGVDDSIDDGNTAYQITTAAAVSADPNYSGYDAANVSLTNTDNDTAGVTVTPTSGLTTTEAGASATFTVVLDSEPTANVSIGLTSSSTGEGTVSPASLTFTAANWNVAQTVAVTGVDDFVDDGNVAFSVVTAAAVSGDANYSGRNATDVSVTNTDNDTAGITVTPTSGLSTTEAGGADTFTIVLDSQPTATVTIPITSGDTTEGTVSVSSVTFTSANWNTPRTITVTGANDSLDDGDIAYSVITGAATSGDSNYSGLNPSNVSITNADDDTAGITVTPTSGLVTTEAGGTATFSVVLDSQPTANVVIGVSSSNTGEGTISTSQLTFTAANWNVARVVTITGVNDFSIDGDIAYSIVTAAAVSSDSDYSGMAVADVSVSNTDNDTAGITFTPSSGLTTTEAGGVATFTVVLNSQPSADVSIGLTSSDTTEATISAASVTFTSGNWNVPQTITVTGVDDFVPDGNTSFTIVTAAATSADSNYNALNSTDLTGVNVDDDTPGVTVSSTSGLTTSEAGGTSSFTVRLSTLPTDDVVINLSTSNAAEGTISISSLTFTSSNWNTPQMVTISGVDDDVDDGNVAYTIITSAAVSSDADYSGRAVADVSVTNTDNDTAGVSITPTSGLVTTEAGGADTFSVVLQSRPTADVTFGVHSSNLAEGTTSPASITFTTSNWNVAQVVTVTGVDDAIDDGNVAYSIVTDAITSADGNYGGMNPANVTVTNTDDDTAGIVVSPTSGLITTEAGGADTFTVVLSSQPTANVSIAIASGNTSEGTASAASLLFTPANWNTPQTVTVTGVDDHLDDGNVAYTIVTAAAVSADTTYSGMNAADVGATNTDNDSAGITVTPSSGLTTTEAGGTASFTLVLDSQPTANVTIPLASSNAAEGTISAASITFTSANWNTPRTVTVTGVDDSVDDGDVAYSVITGAATSGDANYSGSNAANVSVTNTDNDTAGITLSQTSGLTTTELGGTAQVTVQLNSQPLADVTINLSSSDTGEGTISAASLTFTAANWNTPQTITITGVDDDYDDGNVAYTIITSAASSSDPNYASFAVQDISVTNTDNDTAGASVTPTSGLTTTEAGGSDTFSVVLNARPTADVTFALASSDIGEGTISSSSLTFTNVNWNVPRIVTITGVDDAIDDENISYTIVTGAISSADSGYAGMTVADVSVTNTDNDTAGIVVTPPTGLQTSEAGGSDTFTLVLSSQPTANVSIPVISNNVGEGTVSTSSVTFTSSNWNTPQVVTVTGVDDDLDDADIAYTVILAAATSADPKYSGMNPANLAATNADDDTAGITVSPTSGLVTTEAGGTASFTVVLESRPTASVTVPLSSSDASEGSISSASLTFTAANWNVPQAVVVTGVNDDVDDGNAAYAVITSAATSGDANYAGRNPSNVSLSNTDDDTRGVTVSPTSGLITSEAGATATFTLVLQSRPLFDVTIPLSSSDTAEGTISTASVTFTTANWQTPRTVTITGVADDIDDGDRAFNIVTGAATSTDPLYDAFDPSDVSATNVDDDTAGITVSPTTGGATSEAGATSQFTITLDSEPTANVTIGISSGNTNEGTVSASSVMFTPADWNTPQTITVTGVNDAIDDGDVAYSIITAAAASADSGYSGLNAANVSLTNTDDDTAAIVVTPTSGLVTSEAGATASFDVSLASQPTANVTIGITSSDTTEGTVSVSSVTFTPSNWATPQTVTITGVDDSVQDGDVSYTIVTASATSADVNYSSMNAADVAATNTDDDVAGVIVSPTSGLTTDESGAVATFDVVLSSRPTANVTISLASSDVTEGTLSASSVTFTPANWDTPQTITVTGANDSIDDGDVSYTIVTGAAVSTDANYSGMTVDDVALSNIDDDTLGVTITPTSGLVTTESGGAGSFTVALASKPTANVTISLASSDVAEGTVSVSSLTFTPTNWNTPRLVIVTGEDDDAVDGDASYTIVTSASSLDPDYGALDPDDVSLTNTDDDLAGITVTPTSGLSLTEAGGTASFAVSLDSQPTADVTITIRSSDLTEGTISTASLTFTPANWYRPQTIIVTGADDVISDGDVTFSIVTDAASSTDLAYDGIDPADVSVSNADDDVAEVHVSPVAGLTTTEAGGDATFTIVLTSQPTGTVTVPLSSSNSAEGALAVSSVTFNASNWSVPQVVHVTGVNDFAQDGDIAYTIITAPAVSADLVYSGINGANVSLTNIDNDFAGITVSPAANSSTSEAGGSTSFSVVLNAPPIANVRINIESAQPGEASVSTQRLRFTPTDWNVPQIVTVAGIDDSSADGDQTFAIVLAPAISADLHYDDLDPQDVTVTNIDDDAIGIVVNPTAGLVTRENGGSESVDVVLTSQPTANVTIGVSSSDTTEGTISTSSLTFTASNWDTPQTIDVTGVDDALHDGDSTYTIVLSPAVSADADYNGVDPSDVNVTNIDDEAFGISVIPIAGTRTREVGTSIGFKVSLTKQPLANVTVHLQSSATSEGIVSQSSLTFTPGNWSVARTISMSGVNDLVDDENIGYALIASVAASDDPDYASAAPTSVSLLNIDDDRAGVTITPIGATATTEAGAAATFDVALDSRPVGNVNFSFRSADLTEGRVNRGSVTFTPANWNIPQRLIISGVNDHLVDGNVAYAATLRPLQNGDAKYRTLPARAIRLTNVDDDRAGLNVKTISAITTERGGKAAFDVRLKSQPSSDVVFLVRSSDSTEGRPKRGTLTFTSSNWNVAQRVTVIGVNDRRRDGDVSYRLKIVPASNNTDENYAALAPRAFDLKNLDDDK